MTVSGAAPADPRGRDAVTRRLVWTLVCALAIAGLGCALGLLANAVSSAGLPLAPASPPPVGTISLTDARLLFETDAAHFVDARPGRDFAEGHVAGARNVPLEERAGALERLLRELPRTETLIVYCEGGDCESASELSAWFAGNGWRDVRVLDDGYPAWLAAGFPVAQGSDR